MADIVITEVLDPETIASLSRDYEVHYDPELVHKPDELVGLIPEARAMIVRNRTPVDRRVIEAGKRLEAVGRLGTGLDNIDVALCAERGVAVCAAPGVNRESVAEYVIGGLVLLLRPGAFSATGRIFAGEWPRMELMGCEIMGKRLGIIGYGNIGREVAKRALPFDMEVIATDPYVPADDPTWAAFGAVKVELDEVVATADAVTLHVPLTDETHHMINAATLAKMKPGVVLVNSSRGPVLEATAVSDALASGHLGGALIDVFDEEPVPEGTSPLAEAANLIATPHIAGSTIEAQELVGTETATAVRDFLKDGIIRNAVNFPSVSLEEYTQLRPYLALAERLGSLVGQMLMGEVDPARIQALNVAYYGQLATTPSEILGSAVLMGLFRPMLSTSITPVNARAVAAERGVELVESRSTRPRRFTNLVSIRLKIEGGEHTVEGSAFEDGSLRLVLLDGVDVEAPLSGTLLIISNRDQPGVIGDVGSILGRHAVNIANFALGRGPGGAIGVVTVDEDRAKAKNGAVTQQALQEIRALPAVSAACRVRL